MVAILLKNQVKSAVLLAIMQARQAEGVHAKLLYSRMGNVVADDGSTLTVDAVIVPCGNLADIVTNDDARYYLFEAYKHLKPIPLAGDARQFKATLNIKKEGEEGVVEADSADTQFMDTLLTLMTAHRVWSRAGKIDTIPA